MGRTIKHFLRYFLGLDLAESQTTQDERQALSRHAAGRKHLAEIGVFEGLTTALLAQAMDENGLLLAIDPFFPGRLGICWGKWIARREVGKARLRKRVKFIQRLSYDALPMVEGQIDFLFVDGDHSLEGIRRDWADWSPRIAPGGIMALHDTRVPAHNPRVAELGSHQYFEQHIRHDPRFEIVEQVDSLSILLRKSA